MSKEVSNRQKICLGIYWLINPKLDNCTRKVLNSLSFLHELEKSGGVNRAVLKDLK